MTQYASAGTDAQLSRTTYFKCLVLIHAIFTGQVRGPSIRRTLNCAATCRLRTGLDYVVAQMKSGPWSGQRFVDMLKEQEPQG